MSFEGYYQFLCDDGHYWIANVYEHDEDTAKCPYCNKKVKWWNLVNETNEPDVGKIELKVKTEAVYCVCTKCKNKHKIKQETYHIPLRK